MRTSQLYFPTLKETPADAEIISHQLLLRAGLIRKLSSGLYTWLPLGVRVLRNVEKIVREEMTKIGAQEIFMPAIQPAELWQESGRWDDYGALLLKITDNQERHYCFGPTHEEIVTDLVRHELRSYKQLPLSVFQIQTKFRDEIRPRFGLMRAREFIMKDAYSFHIDKASLQKTYEDMYQAYSNIFTRLGLNFRAVMADTGNIGGSASHEFQVLANSGEDLIFYSDESNYAANVELAESLAPQGERPAASKAMEKVLTPNKRTIAEVSEFLKVDAQQNIKAMLVKGVDTPVVALFLRGDHELNFVKAEKLAEVFAPLTMADEKDIERAIGCPTGYIGPVGLTIPVIVDRDAAHLADFTCGANEENYHFTHVNWERDVKLTKVADIRTVVVGDKSPDGHGHLQMLRGIEVGHIFQLGTKYSEKMGATVINEQGKDITLEMGCYGIGVSRIVAAAIEQNHDERGIVWPLQMAPFQLALVPINYQRSETVRTAADALYQQLTDAGISVLLDDRNERPGVMFADMELIGIPHRIVVSERGLAAGTIEYQARTTTESETVMHDNIVKFLQEALK